MNVAILGLGEAGSRFARDLLAAGVRVAGWDPAPSTPRDAVPGLVRARSNHDAVAGADLVLSLNAAEVAESVAAAAASHMMDGAVFADLNTGSPGLKLGVAAALADRSIAFVDVALMAPVQRAGLATPCLACGGGAARFAEMMAPLGTPVDVVEGGPGAAAARKLLRSVFMKGMAAAAVEALASAEGMGLRDWLYEEIAHELETADRALLGRLVEGSRLHARRRIGEMRAVAALEREVGVTPRVAEASISWLMELEGS